MPINKHLTKAILALLTALFLCLPIAPATASSAADAQTPTPIILYNANTDKSLAAENPPPYPAITQDTLCVYCIDVRSMDSFLLYFGGEAVLMDAGGGHNVEHTLALLQALGVKRLKAAINTHPHSDHINGFDEVLSEVPAEVFYTPFSPGENETHDRMLKKLEALGIPVRNIDDGDVLTIGGATLSCLRVPNGFSLNDRSLVTMLAYGQRNMLFTADIEPATVRQLAARCGKKLSADIIKLPHHGQVTMSQTFLDAVDPLLAIVTNGRGDRSRPSVSQMTKRGVPTLYTVFGTVELRTRGDTWYVRQIANGTLLTHDMLWEE